MPPDSIRVLLLLCSVVKVPIYARLGIDCGARLSGKCVTFGRRNIAIRSIYVVLGLRQGNHQGTHCHT